MEKESAKILEENPALVKLLESATYPDREGNKRKLFSRDDIVEFLENWSSADGERTKISEITKGDMRKIRKGLRFVAQNGLINNGDLWKSRAHWFVRSLNERCFTRVKIGEQSGLNPAGKQAQK